MIRLALCLLTIGTGPASPSGQVDSCEPLGAPRIGLEIMHEGDHEDKAAVLTGRWGLAEIRLDGDTERLAPADKARYALEFLEDGTLQVRLFCNRGRGMWTTQGDYGGGSLTLKGLALTRASCPDGGRAARLATSLQDVVSYKVEAGNLRLRVDEPEGVLIWQRLD